MSLTTNNTLNQYTTMMHRHIDPFGNNVCEEISNELQQVIDREVLLEQIPHPHLGISVVYPERNIVDGSVTHILLKEVDIKDPITSSEEIKIDYRTGRITVHHTLEGKYLNVSYWGLGYSTIHSSRVYTKLDEHGNISQTLDELIETVLGLGNTDYLTEILKDIEDAKTSTENNVVYSSINQRLTDIEVKIKGYLENHVSLGEEILVVATQIEDVKNIADDVEYRMGILENNYLNPDIVTDAEIDEMLKGLI